MLHRCELVALRRPRCACHRPILTACPHMRSDGRVSCGVTASSVTAPQVPPLQKNALPLIAGLRSFSLFRTAMQLLSDTAMQKPGVQPAGSNVMAVQYVPNCHLPTRLPGCAHATPRPPRRCRLHRNSIAPVAPLSAPPCTVRQPGQHHTHTRTHNFVPAGRTQPHRAPRAAVHAPPRTHAQRYESPAWFRPRTAYKLAATHTGGRREDAA